MLRGKKAFLFFDVRNLALTFTSGTGAVGVFGHQH